MSEYRKTILPSKVTVVTENIPAALSTVIGLYIQVGSRDEKNQNLGITHMIEHSVFKGTEKRSEWDIVNTIESRGGALNASTSREWTSFYVQVLPEETSLALDVLMDLVSNPLFRESDIKMEKLVIQEEIKEFNDSPDSLIFYHTLKSVLGDEHPLATPILGTQKTVKNIDSDYVREFWKENYTSDRMFISAVGAVEHDKLCDELNEKLKANNGKINTRERVSPSRKKVNLVKKPELNNEYVTLSATSFPYNNKEKFPFVISLSTLGMGMSSRLFQRLRQELGLVYHVSTFNEFFSDEGLYGIYFSTDSNKLKTTINEIRKVINSFRLKDDEIEVAKERIKGNIVISLESSRNRMVRNAKEEMYLGESIRIEELLRRIENTKNEEVREMKDKYFDFERFNITVLGKSKDVTW